MATAGLAALSPTPAQAGWAGQNGRLIAAVYNDSPVTLKYVGGWSKYGFSQAPTDVAVETYRIFEIKGTAVRTSQGPYCSFWANEYNGWFTYEVKEHHSTGVPEYITMSFHGERLDAGGCVNSDGSSADVQPTMETWHTSTPPPSTWRYTSGPPPNRVTHQTFTSDAHTPYPFDVTIAELEGPGQGVASVVSLGDSTISGEGGRWAGNTNLLSPYNRDDAGAQSYWDTPSGEAITDCHRSKSALVHIGHPYRTQNFACSAAMTYSYNWQYPRGWRYKPGVDLYCNGMFGVLDCPGGQMGQLNELYHYARTHNVRHIVLAVGANDFDFSGVTKQCMELYEKAKWLFGDQFCYNSGVMQAAITPQKRDAIEDDIYDSLTELVSVMGSAGYSKSMYDVIIQNYWSPIPSDADIRIPDVDLNRQNLGGCPLLDPDATVLNEYLLPAINASVLNVARKFRANASPLKIRFMDVSEAFKGHRLCEKGVGLIEDIPGFFGSGTDTTVVDKVEWVTEARLATAIFGAYTLAEGGHANYWGQLAQRNCLRILIARSSYPGGKCVPAGGVNDRGEPAMSLTSYPW